MDTGHWLRTNLPSYPLGNFYSHLVKDSVDAADKLGDQLTEVVSDIDQLHTVFFRSSIPTPVQDMLMNSLSHIRLVSFIHSCFSYSLVLVIASLPGVLVYMYM